MDVSLSTYAKCLSDEHRQRYIEKISKIGFEDPYDIKKNELNNGVETMPLVSYPDTGGIGANNFFLSGNLAQSSKIFCDISRIFYGMMRALSCVVEGIVTNIGVRA